MHSTIGSFLNDFKDRLRQTRISMNLSQKEFGKLGGVVLSTQSSYERGCRYPNIHYLAKLAQNDINVNYLLTGTFTHEE